MLTIYDDQGRTLIDGSTKVFKFLGRVTIGGTNTPQSGYVDEPRLSSGKPYAFIWPADGSFMPRGGDPVVDINSYRLSWTFPQADGSVSWARPVVTIVYGIY